MSQSPFFDIDSDRWVLSNDLAFAVLDAFPVNVGHTLVLTKRLVPTWFDASEDEQFAMMSLVNKVKQYLDETLDPKPQGYNIGFNSGEAAGQTVMHVHIHVIPRYVGDVPDPRGGIRHVIPSKGNYLASNNTSVRESGHSLDHETLSLSTGYPHSRLWDEISCRMMGAKSVDILASFVQKSGLDVIEERLLQLLRSQSSVRIMVSDYLSISDPIALKRMCDWSDLVSNDDEYPGSLSIRFIEMAKLPHHPESFHPKSWRIVDGKSSFIAVGSSNLSRPALETGVEWNLLSSSAQELAVHDDFAKEYDRLWSVATPLTPATVASYARRAERERTIQVEPETLDSRYVPDPRPWQSRALVALQAMREAGYGRALVAVATGMGKTWLAAFDLRQVGNKLLRRPRVIVIAHRSHILVQAESAISCVIDDAFGIGTSSWYIGSMGDLSGDLVIASIQKLSRPEGLLQLAKEAFDYAIIDEVHHAHAPTYRRVLARLNASFVLGLTATPERGDGVDVATIFDDNLAYHATIGDGIAEEALVPFHYVGIRDTVNFEQIPWRNGRFDVEELEMRVERSERMERLWRTMEGEPALRTIVFCCSRRHALFTRDWMRGKGITSAAVFSGEGGDGAIESLEALRCGKLKTLCVVDMFNEGLDIPTVDRVIMLRPTESKVIFLQQLGRGLRAAPGKTRLLVIDFVGNHRIFAQRMLHLLSLTGREASWRDLEEFIRGGPPELPAGCLLDVEIEAREVLAQFIPSGSKAGLETYRALRDELGRRPLAAELLNHGVLPKTVSKADGSWFQFVHSEGDLSTVEHEVLERHSMWLRTVETTSLNKSYKMVVLRVLLDDGDLFHSVDLVTFSKRCRRFMLQHPVLKRDLLEGRHALNHQTATDAEWAKWWREWPIDRWLDAQNGQRWFRLEGNNLSFAIDCPKELRATFESMTEELVEWRLATYSMSHRLINVHDGDLAFQAKVSHANGRAILFLPEKSEMPDRPTGLVNVQLPDGTVWEFKFVKVACNVAKPQGSQETNELSRLLRSWFGGNAGLPGTDFKVAFERKSGRWFARPLDVTSRAELAHGESAERTIAAISLESSISEDAKYRTHVPVYDLVAAAGQWGIEGVPREVGWVEVKNHQLTKGMFVARVVGHSMEPTIPSDSWCLFKPCPMGSRQNRLLLVQVNTHLDPQSGGRYTVKKYRSTKRSTSEGWEHQTIELVPINPHFSPIEITNDNSEDVRVMGEFVGIISNVQS